MTTLYQNKISVLSFNDFVIIMFGELGLPFTKWKRFILAQNYKNIFLCKVMIFLSRTP